MSLKASITTEGNVAIIALDGKIHVEHHDVLKENIENLLKAGKQVVIDLDQFHFIGSTGFTLFLQSLYTLRTKSRPIFCNVKSELRQIISAYDKNQELKILNSRQDALTSFFRSGDGEAN